MFVALGPPQSYQVPSTADSSSEALSLQSVATNANGTVTALVSQTHLHFWTSTSHPVFLLSVRIAKCSAEEDPAMHVLWHPHAPNRLVVLTARRIVFFESDINVTGDELLGEQKASVRPFCAAASRVCCGEAVRLESGFAIHAEHAGPVVFIVTTTSGAAHVVSWRQECIVRTWTAPTLQKEAAHITLVPRRSIMEGLSSGSFSSIQAAAPNPTAVAGGSDAKSSQSHRVLTGPLLQCSFTPRLGLLTIVLSSGYIVLARASADTDHATMDFSKGGTVMELTSVSLTSANATHMMLAVATHTGGISSYAIDLPTLRLSATSLWRHNKYLGETRKRFGPVSTMQWSPGDEMLCIGFLRVGVMVLHHSGVCLMVSCAREELSRLPTAAAPGVGVQLPRSTLTGCTAVHWCHGGSRLLVVEPQRAEFKQFSLARALSAPEAVGQQQHGGDFCPAVLLGNNSIDAIMSTSSSDDARRRLSLPHESVTQGWFPLRYGSVSADASWLVCAGRYGFATCFISTRQWFVIQQDRDARSMRCVADPVWLGTAAVAVPLTLTNRSAYEVSVFDPTQLALKQVKATVMLDCRPLALSCTHRTASSDGFMSILDMKQVIRIYRYDVLVDSVTDHLASVPVTEIREVRLGEALSRPLWVQLATNSGRHGDRASSLPDIPLLLVHRSTDHALVCVNLQSTETQGPLLRTKKNKKDSVVVLEEEDLAVVPIRQETADASARVYRAWVERFSPLDGIRVVTMQETGLLLHQIVWSATAAAATPPWQTCARLRGWDDDLAPLCVSSSGGYVLCAVEPYEAGSMGLGPDLEASRTNPHCSLRIRPVLMAHRVLSLLLQQSLSPKPFVTTVDDGAAVASSSCTLRLPTNSQRRDSAAAATSVVVSATFVWDEALFCWLQTLRECGSFVPSMDYFLHTIADESTPAGISGLDRRAAMRAALALLRNYPEFYEIVMGCVRKMDISRWSVILDILGTPLDFYKECMHNHRYAEALHLVRVIMMGNYGAVDAHSGINGDASSPTSASPNRATSPEAIAVGRQAATDCATELFETCVGNGDFASAYDLLRFTALLQHEMGMPAAADMVKDSTSGGILGWLRNMSGSHGAAAADPAIPKALQFVSLHEGDTHNMESEEQQRLLATRTMFSTYDVMPNAVHRKASELLLTGHFLQLCHLLETFSLSLPHFLKSMQEEVRQKASAEPSVWCDVFEGLHIDLGLPRSQGCIGKSVGLLTTLQEVPVSGGANASLWTQAQVVLYGREELRGPLDALHYALQDYAPFDVLLPLLLMQKDELLRRLATGDESTHAARVAQLAALTEASANRGYRSFVDDVIHSLPPALLRGPGISLVTSPCPDDDDNTLMNGDAAA